MVEEEIDNQDEQVVEAESLDDNSVAEPKETKPKGLEDPNTRCIGPLAARREAHMLD